MAADRTGRTGGVVLVLMLVAVLFIGFNLVPNLLGRWFPQLYQATPCENLRISNNRANHQSLIGIGAADPIALEVNPSTLPTTADGFFTIKITVTNTSTGTIPIVINPLGITVNSGANQGLGLSFNPPNSLQSVVTSGVVAPADGIHILGPRQSCVQMVQFPGGNVLVDPSIVPGRTTVQAYYRNSSPGPVVPPANTLATPIFTNAGLWVGQVNSPAVVIPVGSAPS
jgi:hypothetical protein